MAVRRTDGSLRTLTVEGFGLIDRTTVDLGPGLNVFTGETGSGKSMVIDAIGFAFGARAGADVVRAGSAKATVHVEVEPNAVARRWADDNGFASDEGEPLVIAREMQAQGRSSARINGRPATAAQLRELGDILLDVVGQHEHTRLVRPALHREALDAFAGEPATTALDSVRSLYAKRVELVGRLSALRMSAAQADKALADARYAADEIAAARLRSSEIEELHERRAMLANAAKIGNALRAAIAALDDADIGSVASLGRAAVALESIAQFGPRLRELAESTKGVQGAASDLLSAVAAGADEVADDPAAIDALEDRLTLIERLQKKYGRTIEEIVAAGERYAETARGIEGRDEDIVALERSLADVERELEHAASLLTRLRVAAAKTLSAKVGEELGSLDMRGAAFRCAVDPKADGIGPDGADEVEFYASLNANEPERPIARAASGGELSRLLLALKVALADVDPHPIVVLDEIDAGIGGVAARAVGARIAALSRRVQVLCVTHLAQIAAHADEHIALEKAKKRDRVTIAARMIDNREELRIEIARMLSGDEQGTEALRHAEALLRDVRSASKT
ncbi:MAG TPA: DNA repair protein RecN [Candidatus Eremiobacteraceae bacterium]|nr:DNA repair protein RecN [Candidatus Eremiobacteraceae bacterium]